MIMKMTFNSFCEKYLDRMYTPGLPDDQQSTGYLQLKKMVKEGITPATLEEIERWENNPTEKELFSQPDIKYLRFLHPIVREYVIAHWKNIKELEI